MSVRGAIAILAALVVSTGNSFAQSQDPLEMSEYGLTTWANRLFNGSHAGARTVDAWVGRDEGSFDAFGATGTDYVQVFPSGDRRVAAVVRYQRNMASRDAGAVRARLTLIDRSGVPLAEFDVEPHLGFVPSDDGRFIVGHGETAVGALTCGILNNSLRVYAADGRTVRRITSPEFSPAHSIVLLDSPAVAMLAVPGLVVAYALESGAEAWRRPMGHPDDVAWLTAAPGGRRAAVTIQTHAGTSRLELVDAAGTELGRYEMAGRPGPVVGFTPDGRVAIREIVTEGTRLLILDAGSLRRLRTVVE